MHVKGESSQQTDSTQSDPAASWHQSDYRRSDWFTKHIPTVLSHCCNVTIFSIRRRQPSTAMWNALGATPTGFLCSYKLIGLLLFLKQHEAVRMHFTEQSDNTPRGVFARVVNLRTATDACLSFAAHRKVYRVAPPAVCFLANSAHSVTAHINVHRSVQWRCTLNVWAWCMAVTYTIFYCRISPY